MNQNNHVPHFEMEDELAPSSPINNNRNKGEDDIMELLWQDGQVVIHSQQKSKTPSNPPPPLPQPPLNPPLCIGEDEMATWLHYPIEDLYPDLLYPAPVQPPAPARLPVVSPRSFQLFSRMSGRPEEAVRARTEMTVVESNDTPAVMAVEQVGLVDGDGVNLNRGGGGSGDLTVTASSSDASLAETGVGDGGDMVRMSSEVINRKRKGKEIEDFGIASTSRARTEDVELESADEKKHSHGSTTTKRSRAAEVHNLSERRRRDRINERMKALQELIPRSNKSDKASMLDEAIDYLKSLQMQVQMMSIGCGMVPMMYPGMQPSYMPPPPPPGMGMGMDMRMSRPVMPFMPVVPGSALPTTSPGAVSANQVPVTAPQLAPVLPAPAFPMHPFPPPGLSMMQPNGQPDPTNSSLPLAQAPYPADPYYLVYQQMQMQMQMQRQMQAVQSQSQPGSSRPSTSKSEKEQDGKQG